jgi:hypothetical protein
VLLAFPYQLPSQQHRRRKQQDQGRRPPYPGRENCPAGDLLHDGKRHGRCSNQRGLLVYDFDSAPPQNEKPAIVHHRYLDSTIPSSGFSQLPPAFDLAIK